MRFPDVYRHTDTYIIIQAHIHNLRVWACVQSHVCRINRLTCTHTHTYRWVQCSHLPDARSESDLNDYLTDWANDTRHLTLHKVSHLEYIIFFRCICLKWEQMRANESQWEQMRAISKNTWLIGHRILGTSPSTRSHILEYITSYRYIHVKWEA